MVLTWSPRAWWQYSQRKCVEGPLNACCIEVLKASKEVALGLQQQQEYTGLLELFAE